MCKVTTVSLNDLKLLFIDRESHLFQASTGERVFVLLAVNGQKKEFLSNRMRAYSPSSGNRNSFVETKIIGTFYCHLLCKYIFHGVLHVQLFILTDNIC